MARLVASAQADRGIVIGGSGQGEQIAANKIHGIRAALCNDLYTARLSRQHNDANVLAMGGRIVGFGLADEIVTVWLRTPFEGGRHQRRFDQILHSNNSRTRHGTTTDTPSRWRALADTDPEIAGAIATSVIGRTAASSSIASENFVSQAVIEAAGSVITNKYAER